jgi:hypothetical protein
MRVLRSPGMSRFASIVLVVGALCATEAVTAGSAASATGARTYNVDCGARVDGNGTFVRPFNSLADVNALVLAPGQQVLFRRGSTCAGGLAPQGAGAPGRPVVIGAYGRGTQPRIVGTSADAIALVNLSDVVLQDLDVSNPGADTATRRGVHLVAAGTVERDVTVRRLSIHDVDGDLQKDSGGSGGIQLDASGVGGRFDRVLIAGNRIENVARSGIFIVGVASGSRPRAGEPWPEASTRIVVVGNWLEHLAGDGIVATGTDGATLEHNVVIDGNRAGTPWDKPNPVCDAGIWTFDANSTLIQYNEVSFMEFNGCDGTGYDVDYNQDGTVVQYNYSHDNAGGFILLCTDENPHAADVRYNLSVDDAATLSVGPCDIQSGNVGSLDGLRFYDNTIVATKPAVTLELMPENPLFSPGDFVFANNIVVATAAQSAAFPCGNDCTNNLFFQTPASGTNAVTADPGFADGSRRGPGRLREGLAFRLRSGSPAIRAGVTIPNSPARDYFGVEVPSGLAPSIGIDQHLTAR